MKNSEIYVKNAAIVVAAFAILLMVAGFIVPPTGVIDGSVLKASSIFLGFNSMLLVFYCVDKGWGATWQRGDTSVTLSKDENQKD